jgi:predicted transposase YbfD/YdcC
MNGEHYLGFKKAGGEQIWYVAEDEGEKWVALIGWSSGAFQSRHRDQYIGWAEHVQRRRLKYIANNFRFLILGPKGIQNLASRLLSMNLKRLSGDWERYYGHPIFLVETFVQAPYRGTCYLASNWQALGQTRGYGRHAGRYYYHGNKKTIFVFALCRKAVSRLKDAHYRMEKKEEAIMEINWKKDLLKNKESLFTQLRKVPDSRDNRGKRHPLAFILALSVCAMISGAKGFRGIYDWAKKLSRYDLKRLGATRKKIPALSTFREVLSGIKAEEFDHIIYSWLGKTRLEGAAAISFDGKTLCGTRGGQQKAIHLLSALLMDEKVTVAQAHVGEKTNEIPVLQKVLQGMEIKNKIITADAMHTQAETARIIVQDKHSDYVFTVKDNQENLKKKLQSLDYEASPPEARFTTVEKGHGRIDTKTIMVNSTIRIHTAIPFISQTFKLIRTSTDLSGNNPTQDVAYGITSCSPSDASPEKLLRLLRGHWNIENSSHYVRDVTLGEDASRIRTGSAPRIMATFRNLCISLLRILGVTNIARGISHFSWSPKSEVFRILQLGVS